MMKYSTRNKRTMMSILKAFCSPHIVLKPLADKIYVSTDGEQNMQENSCHNSDNGQRWTPQSTIPWWPESLNSAANPRLRARSKIAKKITWEIKDCENSTLSDSSLLSRG